MTNPKKTDSKYNKREFKGVKVDIYRLLDLFGPFHPAQEHAIKKLIRAGNGAKSLDRDIAESIETLERWQEMRTEDATARDLSPPEPKNPGVAHT